MDLTNKKCVPCDGGTQKLSPEETAPLLNSISGWEIQGERLFKTFKFKKFMGSIDFIGQMAQIAEAENHHPDFCVHYNKVEVSIWTHAIGGLSENDFILAAKIDQAITP